jgi:hypothetical protein
MYEGNIRGIIMQEKKYFNNIFLYNSLKKAEWVSPPEAGIWAGLSHAKYF